MKKILFISLWFFLISTTFANCRRDPYSFQESVDEIKSIEIVSAENSLEFTVIKTFSEREKSVFLERFQAIKFKRSIGDPTPLYGEAIKITYQNGDYEMVCHFANEYVRNGEIKFLFRGCDEKEFKELIEEFSE